MFVSTSKYHSFEAVSCLLLPITKFLTLLHWCCAFRFSYIHKFIHKRSVVSKGYKLINLRVEFRTKCIEVINLRRASKNAQFTSRYNGPRSFVLSRSFMSRSFQTRFCGCIRISVYGHINFADLATELPPSGEITAPNKVIVCNCEGNYTEVSLLWVTEISQ